MDSDARRSLIQRAAAMLDEGTTLPAVSLDDFFNGNTDEQSIGVNLSADQYIGLDGFRRVLYGIRERPDVQDVCLEVTEVPDPDDEEDADIWPTASVAFVVTSAPLPAVNEWAEPLHPRDVSEGWCVRQGIKVPIPEARIQPGMRPVRIWLL
jgi:hypothetical protein